MKMFAGIVLVSLAAAAIADDKACCQKTKNPDAEFMAMAQEMMAKAEGKKACCMAKAVPVAKAESKCCMATGNEGKFKVFVAGEGYTFFGCQEMAGQGRATLIAKGAKVGPVQPRLSAKGL
jgi:hypothetical protein